MSAAIVTGAARGIGRAIAERLAADGHVPVLVDLGEQVRETAAELGGGALAVQADVASAEGRAAIAAAVQASGEPLAVLVNNAGITRDALVERLDETAFRTVLRVNLGGVWELTRLLAPQMADGGTVVNLSSRAHLGNVGQFNYAVSKGGVIGLTRALALAHAPRLRVNAVAPGFVATEMTAAMPAHVQEKIVARVPLERAAQPHEIAATVAWLAGPESSYLTGQVLYACGGRSFA